MRQRVLLFGLLLTLLVAVAPVMVAQEDRLQVVGSHSILSDVIGNVVGDRADVDSLMPRGADPHSFQPTPRDLASLADADVVFINGAFFEEGLLEAIENASDDMKIVTASSCVQIIAYGSHAHDEADEQDQAEEDHEHEGEEHAHKEGEMGDMSAIGALCAQHYAEMEAIHEAGHDHEHEEGEDHAKEEGDEHSHDEGEEGHDHSHVETLGALYAIDCGEGHAHEGEEEAHEEGEEHAHDHGACDAHVWMEPHNVMYWTMLIRDTLIELDPANADAYSANAAAYLEQLDALAHDFVTPMVETVPEEKRVLITNHDSFGYFAARYDFEVVSTIIPGGSTLAEPSPADIAALIDLIREEGVPAVFAETTVNDILAEQIASEAGAALFTLYTGSLSDADGPAGTYIDYIRYNVTTIVEALGGGM